MARGSLAAGIDRTHQGETWSSSGLEFPGPHVLQNNRWYGKEPQVIPYVEQQNSLLFGMWGPWFFL